MRKSMSTNFVKLWIGDFPIDGGGGGDYHTALNHIHIYSEPKHIRL